MQPESWRRDKRIQTCMAKCFMPRLEIAEQTSSGEGRDDPAVKDQNRAIVSCHADKITALTLCLRFEKRVHLHGAISVAFMDSWVLT